MVRPLRFKGDKVKDGGINKKKKKPKPEAPDAAKAAAISEQLNSEKRLGPKKPGQIDINNTEDETETTESKLDNDPAGNDDPNEKAKANEQKLGLKPTATDANADPPWFARLTESQKNHERHKMRLQRAKAEKEGVKTHRQKVEEYNTYLSRLSEHHDMCD